MCIDEDSANRKNRLLIKALERGEILFSEGGGVKEFNKACDHICTLLTDAVSVFKAGSFSTAAFLSIAALEEIGKIRVGMIRRKDWTETPKNRKQDLLYSHGAKHIFATPEVILIGSRLRDAIGEKRIRELLDLAEKGGFIELRESSLYIQKRDDKLCCPNEVITHDLGRDIILLALESWDDGLVGLSNHTYELDAKMLELFELVKESSEL